MISTPLLIVALALALAGLAVLGARVRGVLGIILVLQAAYWAAGFLLRSIFLIAVEPVPQKDDPLADFRLAYYGFDRALSELLLPVLFGTSVYIAFVLVLSRVTTSLRTRHALTKLPMARLLGVLCFGWVFRGLLLLSDTDINRTLALVASVAVGLIVMYGDEALRAVTLIMLGLSELLWSFLLASKTPILAFVLWVIIRAYVDGRRASRRLIAFVLICALVAFYLLQNLKVVRGVLVSTAGWENQYPIALQPLLPFLARFDALQANTDAWMAGPSSWKSPYEATAQFLASLVPNFILGSEKPLIGEQWGMEVRRMSINAAPGANLAEGFVAEGWVVAGWVGVFVGAVALAVATVWVASGLGSKRLWFSVLAVALTTTPLLFERGVLAFGEGLGKALQVTVITLVLLSILQLLVRTGSRGVHGGIGSLPPRAGPAPRSRLR